MYITFSVILCLYTFFGLFFMSNYDRSNDDWEHFAAMKSFADAPLDPSHPYSFDTKYSHLFTPYHLFWGLIARLLNFSPFFLSPVIGLINVIIFVFAVYIFADRFLKDSNLASILLLTLLFLWFLAPGYSGYYQFSHLMKTAVYPNRLAFSLALITLSFFPVKEKKLKNLFVVPLVSVVFLIHPLSGLFLFIMLSIQILYLENLRKTIKAVYLSYLIISILLTFSWPFFPVFETIFSSGKIMFFSDYKIFYEGQFILCLIPAIPGLYLLFQSQVNPPSKRIMLTSLLVFCILYLINYLFLHSNIIGRIVLYIAFCLQILTVLVIKNGVNIPKRELQIGYLLILSILAVPQFYIAFKSLSFYKDIQNGTPLSYHSNINFVSRLKPVYSILPKGMVLFAPTNESWILPSLTGVKVLAIKHSDPFVDPEKFHQRNNVVEQFYENDCDPGILKAQNIPFDYILIPKSKSTKKVQESYPDLKAVYSDSLYILFKRGD